MLILYWILDVHILHLKFGRMSMFAGYDFLSKQSTVTVNDVSTIQNPICIIITSFASICREVLSADYSILDTLASLRLMFQKSIDDQSLPKM